jgi:uncharacterized protein YxeA
MNKKIIILIIVLAILIIGGVAFYKTSNAPVIPAEQLPIATS